MTTQASQLPSSFSKDLLSLGEISSSEFRSLLDLAEVLRAEHQQRKFLHQVSGSTLAVLFEKPSTRTRVSFEVGMFELGGHAIILDSKELQASRGETPEDTARALSVFCSAIAARVFSHETLERYAAASSVPVINALSDLYHPCQTLADFQTIKQYKRKLKGLKIAWIGDGNNVCNSFLIGASLSGSNVTVACPEKYAPLPQAIEIANHQSEFSGSKIEIIDSASEAATDADVVVTDTFVSMGQDSEKQARAQDFLPEYQVNEELMARAKPSAIFMHCLPAHRGEEVTASVLDGPQSVVWQEAENRLHSQKSLLYTLLKRPRSSKQKMFMP
ncbi:MAG: ornithine carbamoyltransferase [Thaumarchaeota archaeon]|nr:ornithine carbamoyltransferase [Nitrososphaerota archaeon]